MLDFFLNSFLILFLVMDPVGLVPVFLTLVGHHPKARQERIAWKAVWLAGGLFVLLYFLGLGLLGYLGMDPDALKLSVGVLLLRAVAEMAFAYRKWEAEDWKADEEALAWENAPVFLLAILLVVGPGPLAGLLILGAEAQRVAYGTQLVLAAAFLVLLIAYLLLRAGDWVSQALGPKGSTALTWILGILLAALAVKYVADGVRALL